MTLVDGPSAEVIEVADAAMSEDGSGGIVYLKKIDGRSHVFAAQFRDASDQQLEALQGKTGKEYAEESAKLPDEIATPGEPPPTDSKAPGGGSGGVTLE